VATNDKEKNHIKDILEEIETLPEEFEESAKALQMLERFIAPPASQGMIEKTLQRIQREASEEASSQERPNIFKRILSVAVSQVESSSYSFWFITVLLFLGGNLLMPQIHIGKSDISSIALFAPLIAVFSIFYSLRSIYYDVFEFELACPVTPLQLTLGRLLVVLSYNILLNTATSLLLVWRQDIALTFWELVITWLAPLTFFIGLTFILCIYFGNILGTILALGIWGIHVFFLEQLGHVYLFTQPGTEGWFLQKLMLLLAGIGFILVSAFRSERFFPSFDR
jgi:hypothetical protein